MEIWDAFSGLDPCTDQIQCTKHLLFSWKLFRFWWKGYLSYLAFETKLFVWPESVQIKQKKRDWLGILQWCPMSHSSPTESTLLSCFVWLLLRGSFTTTVFPQAIDLCHPTKLFPPSPRCQEGNGLQVASTLGRRQHPISRPRYQELYYQTLLFFLSDGKKNDSRCTTKGMEEKNQTCTYLERAWLKIFCTDNMQVAREYDQAESQPKGGWPYMIYRSAE